MKTITQFTLTILLSMSVFCADQSADEKTIRELSRQQGEGKDVITYTDQSILVSGLYPRPIIGRKKTAQEKAIRQHAKDSRPNQTTKSEIIRLVISKSGDMAEEFGDFKIEYDGPDKRRTGFTGSYLRVWQKVDGQWKVDASFARPNDSDESSSKSRDK